MGILLYNKYTIRLNYIYQIINSNVLYIVHFWLINLTDLQCSMILIFFVTNSRFYFCN